MEYLEFLGAVPHGNRSNGDYNRELFNKKWDFESALENKYKEKNADEMFKALKEHFEAREIRYIVADFSGGHDEGSIDKIEFQDSDSNPIIKYKKFPEVNVKRYRLKQFDRGKYTYFVLDADHSHEVNINKEGHLIDLIYSTGALDKYGSFAFEGHVDGKIRIDVNLGKWFNSANESYEQYEQTEESGEIYVSK